MITALDAAILIALIVYCAAAGLRARAAASRSLEEYFLAGRTLPGWKAGLSMAATQFAADTPLLVTGLIATAGVFSLWRLWIYAIAFLLMGFVLGGPWRRAAVLTDAELAELRYGGRLALVLRGAKAVYFGVVFNGMVLAMVLYAATRIAEPFLRWEEWLPARLFGAVTGFVEWAGLSLTVSDDPGTWASRSASNLLSLGAILAVTALYSATGGLRAVADTDVVQFAVAMAATLIYAVIVVREAGGLGAIPGRLEALYGAAAARGILSFTPGPAPGAGGIFLAIIAVQWIAQMNADGTGYLAQRTMACRSDRDARHAAVVFVIAQILVRSLLWVAIGLSLLVLFPMAAGAAGAASAAAREASFVDGVALYLPAGARGLMLAGLLAALASTLDTHLNWGASYLANDLYGRILCGVVLRRAPSGRALVWVARFSTLLILAIAIVILGRIGSIRHAWQASLLLGAGIGIPLVLRWTWWRMNAAGELAAIGVSLVLAPILIATAPGEGIRLILMAAAGLAAAVAAALLDRRGPAPEVLEFYRRVRPPGFWGPAAAACGDDAAVARRSLADGAGRTLVGSLALFCILVGTGSWLFGSPPPAWFPWSGAWIALLLTAGGAGAYALARRTV